MELLTATQVSHDYGISTRMLRYYEQIGLLKSGRKEDYAYRVYDEAAIKQLQQIIFLRKLQIPVKQIKDIFNNQNAVTVMEIFNRNIYVTWATIPDDMDVPPPFTKKQFAGGLYACHSRAHSELNMDEWSTIRTWIKNSDEYDFDPNGLKGMYGGIEEHYVFDNYLTNGTRRTDLHIDFYIPVLNIGKHAKDAANKNYGNIGDVTC